MEKIAVVIPTYKPQGYLKKCLDSMEFQTLDKRRFCVYVALNGDKFPYENKVLSLLKSYSFEFKYIYIELASVSNARNKLVEYSDEKLLTFVDDDDFISPNYLEALVDVTTDSVMGVSNMIEEDGGGKPKSHYTSQTYNNLACNQSKFRTRKIYSSACAKAIHRKMIGKIRFDVNLRNGEDSLFMATISNNYNTPTISDNILNFLISNKLN
ncbi:MAG: hypothetical protein Ctma_0616 [Catillopecten margaritatus gill symbiont]|uniref:Glycosyltransferase 2-like domain-containing protein n=1 Tax=Catillopecten margaritatus gill symbiont TaxID=3083288 RepID=A0AAU6PFW0_9GAMM